MAQEKQIRPTVTGDVHDQALARLQAPICGRRHQPLFFEDPETGGLTKPVAFVISQNGDAINTGVNGHQIHGSVTIDVPGQHICREGFLTLRFEPVQFLQHHIGAAAVQDSKLLSTDKDQIAPSVAIQISGDGG